jgi:ribokinase
MDTNYDIVSIGETAVDAFIRIKDASLHCDINKENCQICMDFGAKIPYESVAEIFAVGNAANSSVSASRLGLKSALIANVGDDRNGEECLNSLKKEGVQTELIKINTDKKTNYHYILWFEDDRTILQKHSDFIYELPTIGKTKWIYLTSLGEKSLEYHNQILKYLENNPDTKLAFQPGIFQIKMSYEALKEIYQRTEVFFCNLAEAKNILNIKDSIETKDLIKKIKDLGPKIVILTDGINGAYSYDGIEFLFIPPYPDPKAPYERTGAGDAFASTIVSALCLGKDLKEALLWGPINSMSVVQDIGAQKGLLSKEQIEEYITKAPENYIIKVI